MWTRVRDEQAAGLLRALLSALGVGLDAVQGDVVRLLHDMFVDTCDPRLIAAACRDELVSFYQALLASCESIHIVIEGTEFQQSIKRSVIANVLLVVPSRGRVFIENSLQGVIAASPAAVRMELARAAQTAGDQKLFDFARQVD